MRNPFLTRKGRIHRRSITWSRSSVGSITSAFASHPASPLLPWHPNKTLSEKYVLPIFTHHSLTRLDARNLSLIDYYEAHDPVSNEEFKRLWDNLARNQQKVCAICRCSHASPNSRYGPRSGKQGPERPRMQSKCWKMDLHETGGGIQREEGWYYILSIRFVFT